MGRSRQVKRSNLFLVRLWTEQQRDGEAAWHGRVQRAVSGETHDFSTWPELVTLLLAMVEAGTHTAGAELSSAGISPQEAP